MPRSGRVSADLRLNLGCGPQAVTGWVNIDRSPNIILDRVRPVKHLLRSIGVLTPEHMAPWSPSIVRHDLTRGIPYPDGSAVAVYSSHMLEHIYLNQARRLLLDCRRVMAEGGVLRLALPDYGSAAQQLLAGEAAENPRAAMEFHRRLRAHPFDQPRVSRRLVEMAGSHVHRWFPTRTLVVGLVAEAGFGEVMCCDFKRGRLPDLDLIETRSDSIFVEAVCGR
jgi:predicted SAM-dependent methyltransferase